ncbi:MAG: hypothetical protein AAF533_00790 [Acidobacteriota bacterium]
MLARLVEPTVPDEDRRVRTITPLVERQEGSRIESIVGNCGPLQPAELVPESLQLSELRDTGFVVEDPLIALGASRKQGDHARLMHHASLGDSVSVTTT